MTEGIRVHRLRITDYRGIQALDVPIAPAGVIVSGECRSGKTSILNAITAAITGQDVGPDAIRHGADHAEIFVDLDALTIRRGIDPDGATLNASTAIPHSKQRAKIGQKRLDELFGRGISPMALFRSKPDERKKIVMSAMPMVLKPGHLEEWLTPEQRATFPAPLTQALPVMHGLEAVAAVHKHLYDLRARANADAKGQKGRVEHSAAACEKVPLPAHVTVIGDVNNDWRPTVEAAEANAAGARMLRDQAQRDLDALGAQAKSAAAFEDRTKATREKIETKRKDAALIRANVPATRDTDPLVLQLDTTSERIDMLERELRAAQETKVMLLGELDAASKMNTRHHDALADADRHARAADELEASLAHANAPAPTDDERFTALAALAEAEAAVGETRSAVIALVARADHASEVRELARLEALAAGLTATVDHLRLEAPAQLLKESEGIPGLGLEDGELTIDGVRLDALSGSEQLRVCIDVAKRASRQRGGEGRVLITDGLEALDPKTLREFVRLATADGWQLLATRVTEGDLCIEAIEVDEGKEAWPK